METMAEKSAQELWDGYIRTDDPETEDAILLEYLTRYPEQRQKVAEQATGERHPRTIQELSEMT